MKNIEMIRATKSTLPATTKLTAMIAVTSVAFRGSLFAPAPRPRKSVIARQRTTPSLAIA
jgi:hypothetical protein